MKISRRVFIKSREAVRRPAVGCIAWLDLAWASYFSVESTVTLKFASMETETLIAASGMPLSWGGKSFTR